MLYPLLRPLLFSLDAERAHDLTLGTLAKHPGLVPLQRIAADPVRCMGLDFPNR
ncbi:quinone-dependent dihydroorotate dehydrogenase, partial [Klebsiella pneumoniae]|nr:quinone-dependent dihydroorotate dehydrogenase [Klebsiella pneumoniae]